MKMLEKFFQTIYPQNMMWNRVKDLRNFIDYLSGLSITGDEFIEARGDGYIQFSSQKGTRLIVTDFYGDKNEPHDIYLYYYNCTYKEYYTLPHAKIPKVFSLTVTKDTLKIWPLLDDKFGSKDIDLALWEVENYLYTRYGSPHQIMNKHLQEKKKLMRGIYEV